MISSLSLHDLCQRFGGEVIGDSSQTFNQVSIDSRAIAAGDLFVAIRGERFDGHEYLSSVEQQKACAVVVQSPSEKISLPQWVVKDTTLALGDIAALATESFTGKLVAITGSSGKTTVKGMLHSILRVAVDGNVFATKGNLNNHFGVPLSLFSLTQEHRYAVIEMGASGLGEINYLTHMAKPDVAVINNVMPAHVEGFGSVDNIAKAKGEIYDGLSNDGIAVINLDDKYAEQWLSQNSHRLVIGFSVSNHREANVRAKDITLGDGIGPMFRLHLPNQSSLVTLQVLGEHNVANALAAASCAYALNIDISTIVTGLEQFSGVDGRLQTLQGVNGATVLDDSYNANPSAVCAAIDVLAQTKKQTVLILGDMGELGDSVDTSHREVGLYAKEKNIDCVLTVGVHTKLTSESFAGDGMHFDNHQALIEKAKLLSNSNTVFLIKGSRSSRMDIVVQALKQRGDNKC